MAPLALTRTGALLKAGGQTVRLSGFNFYDAVFSDNISGGPGLTPMATVTAVLDAAVAMGHNAVRIHTAGIGYGKAYTFMPTNGNYNEAAFVQLDKVMDACRSRGLWVMRPFTDRWNFYHGGAISFAEMMGATGTDDQKRTAFFTNSSYITAFLAYIGTHLNRTNTINGQVYKTDATDAIYETGNEIWDVPAAWSSQVTAYFKSVAPVKLTADGSAASGDTVYTKFHTSSGGETDANCDIVGAHFYDNHRMDIPELQQQTAWAASASKVFLVGEYDWRNNSQGTTNSTTIQTTTTRAQWLTALEQYGNGDFPWTYTGPATSVHDDGYQLLVTAPQNSEQTAGKADLAAHARVFNPAQATPPPTTTTGFIQRSGTTLTLNGAPYKPFFGSINGQASPASSVVTLAGQLGLNSVRLTDFIDENGVIGTADRDGTRWGNADAIIAAMATAGKKVILDLACYRNMLRTQLGIVQAYTYDWTPFLSFVLNRVNTVSGVTYKTDPAISYVSFAGEVDAPNYNNGNNETKAQLTAFYTTVTNYWRNNGGQQLLSPGGWLYWNDLNSGIDYAAIAALPNVDIIAIHDYNSSDVSQGLPNIAARSAAAGKPWIAEESGQDANASGQSDTTRAQYFTDHYTAHDAQTPMPAGEGFWNLAMPGTNPGGYDVASGSATANVVIARSGGGATPPVTTSAAMSGSVLKPAAAVAVTAASMAGSVLTSAGAAATPAAGPRMSGSTLQAGVVAAAAGPRMSGSTLTAGQPAVTSGPQHGRHLYDMATGTWRPALRYRYRAATAVWVPYPYGEGTASAPVTAADPVPVVVGASDIYADTYQDGY